MASGQGGIGWHLVKVVLDGIRSRWYWMASGQGDAA